MTSRDIHKKVLLLFIISFYGNIVSLQLTELLKKMDNLSPLCLCYNLIVGVFETTAKVLFSMNLLLKLVIAIVTFFGKYFTILTLYCLHRALYHRIVISYFAVGFLPNRILITLYYIKTSDPGKIFKVPNYKEKI